ncbi:Gfo/Idh/MocA family protein [Gracilibacillus salinarum]|uniref:Gfo/Idh/MocA family oxidoreductase n=1 Tax=Gracilibacillus salinarum TaxID=2932255 RepID=A0ABY4GNB5_9BACI|nr:Gfo/Idh/MocA family oxidoreductase [Gracilibacillus salinarum]UOQ85812.1 Gfo/Idh/MocA family oxidoreductase [Gracilibacillus salinarum]
MSNLEKTNFAILGCGIIAEIHAKGIAETEEASLVAVYDINQEISDAFGNKHGAVSCESLEQMLAIDTIDVVCICTPSGIHAEQTIQVAKAKKHILVEKPMAITLADISAMIKACEENQVLLSTVFPRRMSPQANFARQLIQEGRLGKLSLCSAYVKLYRDQAYYDSAGWRGTWEVDGGGAMMNQGIHTVDMLQWLAGPVASLYGRTKAVLRDIEVEDTALSLLQFENGAMGVLEITTTAYDGKGQRLAIHGEKGTLEIEEDTITKLEIDGEEVQLPEFEDFEVIPDGHRLQIKDMALAVQDKRPPLIPGTEGQHSLEIILGTYQSSRLEKQLNVI